MTGENVERSCLAHTKGLVLDLEASKSYDVTPKSTRCRTRAILDVESGISRNEC